ncbi:MAG TPA: hypothetical protein VGY99_13035 [Candidatus Binataceae bacterium]|nr:hypothetical protein [Candidatus Binataceae bacterium]
MKVLFSQPALIELRPAMRAGARRLAWLGLFACLGLAIGGCYSSDYGRQSAATASMLRDLAAKLGDYCRADFKLGGGDVSSEEMGEFYYGLKKARSYAGEAASGSTRQSYRDLTRLIDDYGKLLSDADRYRLAGKSDPQRLKEILDHQQKVSGEAQTVLSDLRKEG